MSKNFAILTAASVLSAAYWCSAPVRAAEPVSVALKSGESADQNNLFWVANCKSLLNAPMTVEVLDGPPELTASIREQKIVPHFANCAKPVNAGVLVLTAAKEIKVKTQAKAVLRVIYPTVDGKKQKAFQFDVILLP